MIKLKLILLALILSTTMVTTASAVTGMTADQLRAEIARLTKVAETIRTKLAQLGAGTTTGSYQCLQTNLRMGRGDSGESVTRLQQFLVSEGVYASNLVTGYFGPATEAGVQRWQVAHGVVSYGTPSSTGFGTVGPSTLRYMHGGCPGGVFSGYSGSLKKRGTSPVVKKPTGITIEKYTLSLNPSKGLAPLAATAEFKIVGSTCTSYSLNWGDGTAPVSHNSGTSTNCQPRAINITRTHVYNTPRTYEITFKTGKGPLGQAKTVNVLKVESLRSL